MDTDRDTVNALLIDHYDTRLRAAHSFLDIVGATPTARDAGYNVVREFATPRALIRCKVVDRHLAEQDRMTVAWAFSGVNVVVPLLDGTINSPECAAEQGAAIRMNMDLAYQQGVRHVIALFNLLGSQFSEAQFDEVSHKLFHRMLRIGFDSYRVECVPIGFHCAYGETFATNIDHPSSESDLCWYHGPTAFDHFEALLPKWPEGSGSFVRVNPPFRMPSPAVYRNMSR